jgi:excisionase family DNA binding protein
MYSAQVEVANQGDFTNDELERVLGQLEPYHAAIGVSPRGYRSAQISLPAEALAQACTTAMAVVAAALEGEAIACEVMIEHEFGAREGFVPVPDLVSVTEAATLLGVSRQAVLQRIASKSLPAEKVGREYVIPRAAVAVPSG